MTPMLRTVTVTLYDQAAWLTKIGLLPGSLRYEQLVPYQLPSIAKIQDAVAKHFRIPSWEMTSHRRHREVARPRQVAMYLSRKLGRGSLPEIGRRFGGRDHTTVIHAIRQVEKLMLDDGELALAVATLIKQLTPDRGAPCIGRRG